MTPVVIDPEAVPDLTWRATDLELPPTEPDSADVPWVDQPYDPPTFVDCGRPIAVDGMCHICYTAEPPCDSRNGDGEPQHRACEEAQHEAAAQARRP